MRPEVLENMLVSIQINKVMKDIDFGENDYVYAIDAKEGNILILAHKESFLIGKSAEKACFAKEFAGNWKAVVNGMKGYYQAEAYQGQIIETFMPSGEYYGEWRNQTLVVTVSMIVIFGVLLFMINQLVDKKLFRELTAFPSP